MALRVVGAGLGRTGTLSLQRALEQLLAQPCYHMLEVLRRPQDIPVWHRAVHGHMPDWHAFLADYGAAVDWPVAAFWKEISTAFPGAMVVLSIRDPEAWWSSASATIFQSISRLENDMQLMIDDLFRSRFTSSLDDRDACIAAYEAHVADVRRNASRQRLVEWRPSEGWAPLCAALGIAVPDEPFPHENTTSDFKARRAEMPAGGSC
jgi:hypothetical protein